MTFSEITSGIDTLTRIGVEASGSTGGGFQHSWRLVRDHVRLDTVQAAREANRNRTQYFIGCSSVFVVVLLTALMVSGSMCGCATDWSRA